MGAVLLILIKYNDIRPAYSGLSYPFLGCWRTFNMKRGFSSRFFSHHIYRIFIGRVLLSAPNG